MCTLLVHLQKGTSAPLTTYSVAMPPQTHVKYLGIQLDSRFSLSRYKSAKLTQIKLKTKCIYNKGYVYNTINLVPRNTATGYRLFFERKQLT